MFAVVSEAPTNGVSFTTLLYILLAVASLLGSGGVYWWWQLARRSGVRDERQDRTADVVLGIEPSVMNPTGTPGLVRRLEGIERMLSPNGLDSQSIGDVAKRVELAVEQIDRRMGTLDKRMTGVKTTLDRHIGQHDERDAALGARIAVLEAK